MTTGTLQGAVSVKFLEPNNAMELPTSKHSGADQGIDPFWIDDFDGMIVEVVNSAAYCGGCTGCSGCSGGCRA